MGPGNERGARERTGGPESWTVPPPWKLYFNPCASWWNHYWKPAFSTHNKSSSCEKSLFRCQLISALCNISLLCTIYAAGSFVVTTVLCFVFSHLLIARPCWLPITSQSNQFIFVTNCTEVKFPQVVYKISCEQTLSRWSHMQAWTAQTECLRGRGIMTICTHCKHCNALNIHTYWDSSV